MNYDSQIDLENDTFEEIFKKIKYNLTNGTGIKYFNTDQEMISESRLKVNDCCITLGGTELNDGKQAIYKVVDKIDESIKSYIQLENKLYAIKISGFSGGGESIKAQITSDFPSESVGATDDQYTIKYFFSSPNFGNGTVTISIDDVEESKSISQGNNYISLEKFTKGTHIVKVYVVDSAGVYTNQLTFTFKIGSLEISTSFNDSVDYSIADNININFNVQALTDTKYVANLSLDGAKSTMDVVRGKNTWNIGQLELGPHTATIQVVSDSMKSNIIKLSIVIADGNSLIIISNYDSVSTIDIGKLLAIPYRISMKNVKKFKSYYYLDGTLKDTASTSLGVNYWNVGELSLGDHTLKIKVTNADGDVTSNELTFKVTVQSEGFTPFEPVTTNLIAYFDARDNNNSSENRQIWQDRSGNNTQCKLYNFNFSSNGWKDNYLQFSGDSYAEIEYSPLKENAYSGFTFDILFQVENVGNIDGRVCDFKLEDTPYIGFTINTYQCMLSSSKTTIATDLSEKTWIRKTVVIDKANSLATIYVNGIMTKVSFLDTDEDFTLDKTITLGGRKNNNNEIVDTSNCKIKTIRIYDRALNHEEVLQNHIADIHDKDEQLAIRKLNFDPDGMPSMYFYGDVSSMTKEHAVPLRIRYNDPKDPSKNFDKLKCTVKWQGTSTIFYAVKNYKIKLVNDDGSKFKYSPVDTWLPESTFTLKADYMESSHANNIGTAKFLEDYYETKLPPQESNPLVRNAIDGFPMLLYINGKLAGIYDFNIDKGAENCFGFKDNDKCMSYEVSANSNLGAGAFATDNFESIKEEFEVRFHPDEENVIDENETLIDGKHPELQELVSWVCNADDNEFKTNFEKHFNLDYALGYFVLVYTLGMVDNLGKNMMLTTYDGQVWYTQFYDMDTMLGLDNTGFKRFGPDVDMSNGDYNTSNSKLWTKFQRNFASQIRARYIKLRNSGKLSVESIIDSYITKVVSKIGQRYYNLDMLAKYIPYKNQYVHMLNGSREEFTKRWITERFIYMDSIYNYGSTVNKFCTVRSNISGTVHLRIKTYSPQMVTVSFSGAQGNTQTLKCEKDSWTTFTGFISTERDNEINISNAGQIMYLDGIKDLYPSVLLLGEATKLVELDCSNSPYMRTLELSTNYLLQKVDCSGCEKLGDISASGNPRLDVSSSINLKYLDCSGTKLSVVKFNTNGGALRYLNCSNTPIVDFTIAGQEFLKEVNLSDCSDLARLSIKNCGMLESLLIPDSRLESFTLEDCTAIKTLDLSNTPYLEKVDLINCSNLEELTLKSLINSKFTELDLSTCTNLEVLDISGCTYLNYIRLSKRCTSLVEFYAEQSGLKGIQYGSEEYVDVVDLTPFNLEDMTFKNCVNLKELKVNEMYVSDNSQAFLNCVNLEKLTGHIVFPEISMRMFESCEKLQTIPSSFDFHNVISADNMFMNSGINTESFERVIKSMYSVRNLYCAFNNCSNIQYTESNPLPDDIFSNCTDLEEVWGVLDETNIYVRLTGNLFKNNPNLIKLIGPFPTDSIHGTIPYNLFQNNEKLIELKGFFNSQYITSFSEKVFEPLVNLTTLEGCFQNCTNMTGSLSSSMFAKNTKLQNVSKLFKGCSKLAGNIPAGLFDNNTEINDVSNLFDGCTRLLGSIPESLFAYCPKLKIASRVFRDCVNLTGDIPEALFNNNKNISTYSGLFEGCEKLTFKNNSFPESLFKNKASLIDISYMFRNCIKASFTLKAEAFRNCINLSKISYLFDNCVGLTGSIPRKLFIRYNMDSTEVTTPYLEAEGIFKGCKYLEGQIPDDVMSHFDSVQSIDSFFENCLSLVGEIPATLLKDCKNLVSAASLFSNTPSLGKYQVRELTEGVSYTDAQKEESYFISSNFLSYCPKLVNTDSMFFGWPNGSGLKGTVPPKLFSYCPELVNIASMFDNSSISGSLPEGLFANNPNLVTAYGTFKGCNITKIAPDIFTVSKNPNIINFNSTFEYCYSLTGAAPELWTQYPTAQHIGTFHDDTSLTNYSSIPDSWK